jgi:hypothetical protein
VVGDVTVSRSWLPKNQVAAELRFDKIEPTLINGGFLQDAELKGRLHPLAGVGNVISWLK